MSGLTDLLDAHLAEERARTNGSGPTSREAALLEAVVAMEARLLTPRGLIELPPPRPLIDEVLFRDTLAGLYGLPGSWKSFHARDMACSVAAGIRWQGHAVQRSKVLYVVAEAPGGFGRRVAAWCDYQGVDQDDLAGWLRFLPEPVNLFDNTMSPVIAHVAARWGARLVVFDTLSKCSAGADENNGKDMTTIIAGAELVRVESAATVLLVHHSPKTGTPSLRGHSALAGALDTSLLAEREGKAGTLACDKQKDADPFRTMEFRAEPSHGSLVLLRSDLRSRPQGTVIYWATVRALSDYDLGSGIGVGFLVDDAKVGGKSQVHLVLNSLLDCGYVEKVGLNRSTTYRLTEAGRTHLDSDGPSTPVPNPPESVRLRSGGPPFRGPRLPESNSNAPYDKGPYAGHTWQGGWSDEDLERDT